MKRAIIIQARLASTRFPRKVLAGLDGKSLLWRVVDRCRRSRQA
jgi:spore coat polysaccharide biosynthesis protein SpsF (cytidylyltransferase family)